MAKLVNKTLIIFSLFLCISQLHLVLSLSREPRIRYDEEIKNPCKIAKQRKLPKEFPVIRVIDEITGESPDVLLGQGGITYYMLPATTPSDVVIECSSSFDRVEWVYRGRGASSGLKVVNTLWSSSSPGLKTSCHSAALVFSNITDQLTGEYTCITVPKSGEYRENSFLLFVPYSAPFYHKEGSTVNVTVPAWTTISAEPVTIPCISKKRTGAGISLYRITDQGNTVKVETGPYLKFDPFIGFRLIPTKKLFENSTVSKFVCKFDKDLVGYENLQNRTLLNVNLILRSDEKLAPEKPLVRASSPYFSWTTKQNPRVELNEELKSEAIEWQQLFTKNDYEEPFADASPLFYLGSLHLVNLTEGSEGEVSLYDRNKTGEDGLIHKWNYEVLDKEAEDFAGLSYKFVQGAHVFTCLSASDNKPTLSMKELFSDEDLLANIESNETETELFSIIECPNKNSGCLVLTTLVPQGEVTCIADGVDRTLRFPVASLEPSRPFFIERGETIKVVHDDDTVVTLPCMPNAPEAQYSVHLFKKTQDGYENLWSGDAQEKSSEGVEFSPNWGFLVDTSYPDLADTSGEYLCTSSANLEDRSDALNIIVTRQEFDFTVVPKQSNVYGQLPFTFEWTSDEELDVLNYLQELNKTGGVNQTKEKFDGSYHGAVVLLKDLDIGDEIVNITLVKKNDTNSIHTWNFRKITPEEDKASGFTLDTKVRENGEHTFVLTCQAKSKIKPRLTYHMCQSPNSCDLMKRCSGKDCNPDHRYETSLTELEAQSYSPCLETEGCARIILKSVPLNGFLKASCNGDGVKEQKTVSDVFFREDIHWDTREDTDLLYLYVNMISSTDQNPQREVRSIGSNVDWEIGDTAVFSCAAAPFLFSNGIKWAIETKDGVLIYQKDNIFDPQFKYTGPTQVLSTFTLVIDSFEIKRVWCFAPTLRPTTPRQLAHTSSLTPPQWKNVSQPIFIRPDIDENCHETEASIRLLNVYPPLSKLDVEIEEPRLDKKPYFVLPQGAKQFAVKVTAPEPIDWIFTGYGSGPSMTPMIQSERQIKDFYDISTYCYTSKLLVNLRNKRSNDTGRYVAKFKYHPETFLSFYLFVPSEKAPYLLRSGSEVNETWTMLDKPFYLPCLVNSPNVSVELFRKNVSSEQFERMEDNDGISYDPTVGYIFQPNKDNPESLLGTYKCIAEQNEEDFLILNVLPQAEKKGELKYEKVGEIHIFTCISKSSEKPFMNFTELPSSISETNITYINKKNYTTKECPDGCLILMTTSPRGKVHCVGDGVDESYRFPTSVADGNARNADRKTGLWYDAEVNVFKCQTNSILPPTLAAVTCRRPNECEVMQSLLRGEGDKSQSNYSTCGEGCAQLEVNTRVKPEWPSNWFSVFVRCKGDDNMEIFSQYFHDKNETVLVTKEAVEKFRQVRLDTVSFVRREETIVHAKFRCFANRYFYSRGFQWALEKQNGAFVFQDHLAREVEVQNFGSTMSEIVLDFDENVYNGLWCFVPLLDSPKWANTTISFPVQQVVFNF